MNKILTIIIVFVQVFVLFPMSAKAVETGLSGANIALTASVPTGLSTASSLQTLIGRGINVVLGILGIVFLLLMIYSGFLYLTSQGDSKAVTKAKDIWKTSVFGLVIIIAAYAIASYVIQALTSIAGQ
jgi:hypothetical protein